MNMLSWFLYLASVLPYIKYAFFPVVVFGLLMSIPLIIFGRFVVWTVYSWSNADKLEQSRKTIGNYGIRLFAGSLIAMFMLSLIPNERTFYMIAASELGETVITHPDTVEVYDEVREAILGKLREYNDKPTQ